MVKKNNKTNSKERSSLFQKINKIATSATIFALLFPSISSIMLVQAAEDETNDPPVEETVPQYDSETDIKNNELEEDTEFDIETPLPDTTPEEEKTDPEDTSEASLPDTVQEEDSIETEKQDATHEDTIEEVQDDAIVPTQSVPEQDLSEPTEVSVLIHVRAPNNMENYINTLEDFTNYPLILTNQVTGETFTTSIRPNDNNSSNYFTLEATVHAYVRGYASENDYDITLPQELIDLGYSLTRDHRVRSNFGIVGSTNLSYNAPQVDEIIGLLRKNTVGYSHLEGRDLQILLESLDGTRSYSLGNRDISIPAGEYNLSIGNTPTDSRPSVIYRRGTLVNVPETEIPMTKSGDDYLGSITLDFTSESQTHVLRIIETDLDISNTVTIDPNGGTIDPEFEKTEVREGENYTLEYASTSKLFRKGHSLTGYTVEGTLLDSNGNEVTEIKRFKAEYTPLSDVTLTANWEVTTGKFTLVLFDGSAEADKYNISFTNIDDGTSEKVPFSYVNPGQRVQWIREDMPYGHYQLSIDGFKIKEARIRGWKMDKEAVIHEDGTATVYLEYEEGYPANHATLDIEVEPMPATNTVTINPNGGTIDPEHEVTVVENGDTYTLPYTFQSGLSKPGYTLVGYAVDGTLLDSNGNAVTELTRYTGTYTPESDVTLTAIWEVTAGGFRIQLYDDEPSTQTERYTVSLIAENGTEYELTSNQFGPGHRTWKVEDIPNGTYTLAVNGFNISEGEKFGQPDTTSDFIVNDDGTATVELEFVDNKSTTFIRYRIYGEPAPEVTTHSLGIEIRDLDNQRTDNVDINVTNADDEVFTGSYNEYLQWFTDEELPEGLYTITLTTPEGTIAEINDTVASQHAVATDEENIFTIEVNEENQGSLSAVFAAFRLVEVPPVEVATYQLGVEIRDLDNKRTDDVEINVTNADDEVFTGSYNEYLQWFTEEELPEGLYTITLTTPEGTVAEINDTVASQRAVATDEENVFTIEVNEENQGSLSAVFAAFRLAEVPPVEVATYQLGVEVRGLDDKRTDKVNVVVTNQEGEVFNGSYNQYKQWLTDEELPEGLYTITLTTPEGTIAEINDTTDQYAVTTDEKNVFTILLNDENLGYGSSIYGAFRLIEVDEDTEEPEEPTDPEEPEEPTDPTDPSEPEKPGDPETPDDKEEDDSEKLPQTGMVIPSIGLGFASILGGLGLLTINKKRKEEDK